jgi:hypothetical protein
MALKTKRLRQSGRRPIKSSFLQSKAWENTGHFSAFAAGGLMFFSGAPVLLAGIAWFVVGALLVFVLPNYDYARCRQQADDAYQLELTKDPRKTFLIGAETHLRKLGNAHDKLPRAIGQHVETLHEHATTILNAVDEDISKSVPIATFFTTHLPEAARLTNERLQLPQSDKTKRRLEIDQALEALTHEFAAAQTAMMATEMAAVDIDLRLLGDSMDIEVLDTKRHQ